MSTVFTTHFFDRIFRTLLRDQFQLCVVWVECLTWKVIHKESETHPQAFESLIRREGHSWQVLDRMIDDLEMMRHRMQTRHDEVGDLLILFNILTETFEWSSRSVSDCCDVVVVPSRVINFIKSIVVVKEISFNWESSSSSSVRDIPTLNAIVNVSIDWSVIPSDM